MRFCFKAKQNRKQPPHAHSMDSTLLLNPSLKDHWRGDEKVPGGRESGNVPVIVLLPPTGRLTAAH